jgi:hypothetical protein
MPDGSTMKKYSNEERRLLVTKKTTASKMQGKTASMAKRKEGRSASGGLNQKDVILIIKANQVPILKHHSQKAVLENLCARMSV